MIWLVSLSPAGSPNHPNYLADDGVWGLFVRADDRLEALEKAQALLPDYQRKWTEVNVHQLVDWEAKVEARNKAKSEAA